MKLRRRDILPLHHNPKLFVQMGDMRAYTPATIDHLIRRVAELSSTGRLDLLTRVSHKTCRLMQLAEPFHARGDKAFKKTAEILDRQILGRLPYYTLLPLPALLALQNELLGKTKK